MHPSIRRCSLMVLLIACSAAGLAASSPGDPSKVKPLAAGALAPAFVAREADGKSFAFNPRKLGRPVMLIFYRGGWCPYCNAHLKDLRGVIPEVSAMGYDVLFLSTDRPQLLVSSLKEPVDYHLLSDSEVNAARAFGIAYRLDDATYEKYKTYGLDLEQSQGAKHHELPVPAVFIVDRSGTIRFAHSSSDYTVRLPAADVLAAARSVSGK